MACGTGKTLTSYWINNALFNKKTVIFVPSLYLLSQFYSDWINQSYAENNKLHYLLVGSDADVEEEVKYKSNGLILYTNPKSIRQYIKSIVPSEKLIVISTYQSADKLTEACKGISFDFGIFDEAHKTVGQANQKFSSMLTDDHVKIRKRMFMTATPKIYGGDLDAEDIISMDNKDIYGHNFLTYSTSDAIKDKRLVDYQVISLYAKNADIIGIIQKNKLVKFQNEVDFDAKYVGIIILLLKKIHDNTCKHLITYHNKVSSATKFAGMIEIINNILYDEEILVDYLSGSTSMMKRMKIIRDFTSSTKAILCSARVLNEGVNIPVVDSVCFVDPRFSTIDIVQCIGRALRLSEGKSMAHVIVPIFIDNFEDDFDRNAHGNIVRILKALKTTDSRIIEYFKMRMNGSHGEREIVVNEFYNEKYSKKIDLEEWNDVICEKIWRITDNFECMYEKVKKWVKDNNGKYPLISNKNQIEKTLGLWCNEKRQNYKKGMLSEEKIKKIEQLPGWFWIREDIFNEKIDDLLKWVNDNNKIPSMMSKNRVERTLGSWCTSRRMDYKNNVLSEEKIKKLEQIPGWYWKRGDNFNKRCKDLQKWTNNNEKLPSNRSQNPTEKQLGIWCSHMRQKYKKGILSEKQIHDLNRIKHWYWDWADVDTKKFEESYTKLKKWVEKNNKIPSITSKNQIERNLGIWCMYKRNEYKNETLSTEKINKLEQFPCWFWKREDNFNKKIDDVQKWVSNNNKIPSMMSKNRVERTLGNWCSSKRTDYKNNALSEEKIKKLEQIPGWYWKRGDIFNEKCQEVHDWINNNDKIPAAKSENQIENDLGSWCTRRRNEYSNGTLPEKKIKKLERLPGWFWSRDDIFNKKYEEVKKWINDNDKYPSKNSKNQTEKTLGTWCSERCRNYKEGVLSGEKIKKIEQLPGWFWKH